MEVIQKSLNYQVMINTEVLSLGDVSVVSSGDPSRFSLLNTKENREVLQEELNDFLETLSGNQLELLKAIST